MAYSGKNYRNILSSEEISFNLNFHLDNVTGIAALGFSGDTSSTKFEFVSGRIYDPEHRYVFSYTEDNTVNLSGNMSGSNYDYFINQTPVCFAGERTNENVTDFFINTTGVNFYTDSFDIFSRKFNYKINFDTGFIIGRTLTGKLESLDAGNNFRIFSGEVVSPTGYLFSGFDSGERQSSLISLVPSGTLNPYNQVSIETNLYTNFGQVFSSFDSIALPISPYDTSISLIDIYSKHGLFSGKASYITDRVGEINTGDYIVLYNSFNREKEVTGEKEIKVSLLYQSGKTGTFHRITGISGLVKGLDYTTPIVVTISGSGDVSGANESVEAAFSSELSYFVTGVDLKNSGANYQTAPDIIFSGRFGESGASGKALMDFAVKNVQITNSGSGYQYAPSIVFTGGQGQGAAGSTLTGSVGNITGTQITNGGSGYTGTFYVEFTGGSPDVAATGYATTTSGQVTGIKITNGGMTGKGGRAYVAKPGITFLGGSPYDSANGQAILGSGYISRMDLIQEGVYFSGLPTIVSISGGAGTGASGFLMTTSYEKTLTGDWNIYTGINRGLGLSSTGVGVTGKSTALDTTRSLVNYFASGYTVGNHKFSDESGLGMIPSGDSMAMRIFHFANYDRDLLVARLEISGLGGKILTRDLTGVR